MNDIPTPQSHGNIAAADLSTGQRFYLYGHDSPWSLVEVTDVHAEPDFGPGYVGVGIKRLWLSRRPFASTIFRPGERVDVAEVSQ